MIKLSRLALSCLIVVPFWIKAENYPTGIPADFRALWEEHSEIITVRFYGRSLGEFRATVYPENIRFADPAALLEKLPVKTEKRSVLLKKLMSPLSRNGYLVCQRNVSLPGRKCGFLRTDTLAVIFDDNESAADIFVNKDYVRGEYETSRYWVPTPEGANAFIHRQTLNYSDNESYKALALSGTGAVGVTENSYALVDWASNFQDNHHDAIWRHGVDDVSDHNLNSLYYRYDYHQRYYVQGGRMDNIDLFRMDGGGFTYTLMPLPRAEGVRVGTTEAYMRQPGMASATPVSLMLSQFSRVEAYRNGQLLKTYFLDAGVQNLDTRGLPDGQYPLELRIFEQDRFVRKEEVAFNKSNLAVNLIRWNGFVQAGEITDRSPVTGGTQKEGNKEILAGVRLPVAIGTAFQQGGAVIDGHGYAESRLDWGRGIFSGSLNTGVSLMRGPDGIHGDSETIAYNDGFSLSFYHYHFVIPDCSTNYLYLVGCSENYNINLSVPVKNWLATVGYMDSRSQHYYSKDNEFQPGQPPVYPEEYDGNTQTWQLNLTSGFIWKDYSLTPSFGLYRTYVSDGTKNDGLFFNMSLTKAVLKNVRRDYHTVSAGYSFQDNDYGRSQQNAYLENQWGYQHRGHQREIGNRISGSENGFDGMLRGRDNSAYGDVSGAVSASHEQDDSDFRHSLLFNYDSSLAINRHGLFWGGNANGIDWLAGTTLQLDAEQSQEPLARVRGKGGRTDISLYAGQQTLVPVTAMEPTGIQIDEITDNATNVQLSKTGVTRLFLLPGHVYYQRIHADTSWTYIGRALDVSGRPLSGATVLNAHKVCLSQEGGFTFDHTSRDERLFLLQDDRYYSCPVSTGKGIQHHAVLFLGELTCQRISRAALPAWVSVQNTTDSSCYR